MMTGSVDRKKTYRLILAGLALLLYIIPVQINPENFIQDDSYFYLQVAYHITNGDGSTFNTITSTNGYHPLWMLLVVLCMAMAGGDKALGLYAVFGVQALIFVGIAIFFYKIAKFIHLRYWEIGVALLAGYFLSTGIYGSEAHVNGLMTIGSIYFILRASTTHGILPWMMAGIFVGLSVLARLDNVFIVFILCLFALLVYQHHDFNESVKRISILSIIAAGIVLPYLIYNVVLYGHIVPISGAIKSTFPNMTGNIDSLGKWGKIAFFSSVLSLLLACVFDRHSLRSSLVRALSCGVLLHAYYVIFFTDHYTFWPWYYVSGILNISLSACLGVEYVSSICKHDLYAGFTKILYVTATSFILVSGVTYGWMKAYNPDSIGSIKIPRKVNQYRWHNEFAFWLKENLPSDSGILVYDWPGSIAYHSGLRILPMDGLIGDYAYNDHILEMGINGYICSKQVNYFVGLMTPEHVATQQIEVYAPLYRKPAGKLSLTEQNLLVKVQDVVHLPAETPPVAIWKLDPACSNSRLG